MKLETQSEDAGTAVWALTLLRPQQVGEECGVFRIVLSVFAVSFPARGAAFISTW